MTTFEIYCIYNLSSYHFIKYALFSRFFSQLQKYLTPND